MVTDSVILGKFFELLNVPGVTGTIDGEVFKITKPINRQSEDIVIGILLNNITNNEHMNTGEVNINCFTAANNDHTSNTLRIETILLAVINALNLVNGEGNHGQLNYRIASQKTFRDYDDPLLFFSNIKLNFSHKN